MRPPIYASRAAASIFLPIALAILIAKGAIPPDALADLLVLGELG
jgi:predicted ATPase with chaperone activity